MEYLVIMGFALVLFIPLLFMLFQSLRGYEKESGQVQAAALSREIVATAERVWHHGPPSRLTFEARMPDGIANMTIRRNDPATTLCVKCTEIMFEFHSGAKASASTNVDIIGIDTIIPPATTPDATRSVDANGVVTWAFDPSYFGQGVRRLTLETFTTNVTLRRT